MITIITATFNSEAHIERALLSFQPLIDEKICELVIIDGKSEDNTIKIINKYKSTISFFISELDNGVYDAWNKGIKASKSEWIIFIGSDDFIFDAQLFRDAAAILKTIDGNKNKVVFGNLVSIDNHGKDRLISYNWNWYKKSIIKGKAFIPHPSTFHHRSLFMDYGYFDITYKIAGDYHLLTKYLKKQNAIHINKTITAMRKGGLSSNPKTLYKTWIETRRARIENRYKVNSFYFISKGIYYFFLQKIEK